MSGPSQTNICSWSDGSRRKAPMSRLSRVHKFSSVYRAFKKPNVQILVRTCCEHQSCLCQDFCEIQTKISALQKPKIFAFLSRLSCVRKPMTALLGIHSCLRSDFCTFTKRTKRTCGTLNPLKMKTKAFIKLACVQTLVL